MSNEKHIEPRVADIHWGNVNLALVQWSQITMLGDEYEARQKNDDGKAKDQNTRLTKYEAAVRANRQLAVALQTQGLNEDAIRFTCRTQVLQRHVFGLQSGVKLRQRLQALEAWLFSWFLFLLTGYGYRLWHSFLAYELVIIGFMAAYYVLGASLVRCFHHTDNDLSLAQLHPD